MAKNPDSAHWLENEIAQSVFEEPLKKPDRCMPIWVEKSINSFYLGYCPFYGIRFTLEKRPKGWIATVKFSSGDQSQGYSPKSKESALLLAWRAGNCEFWRELYEIPHKLDWGDFSGHILQDWHIQHFEYVAQKRLEACFKEVRKTKSAPKFAGKLVMQAMKAGF